MGAYEYFTSTLTHAATVDVFICERGGYAQARRDVTAAHGAPGSPSPSPLRIRNNGPPHVERRCHLSCLLCHFPIRKSGGENRG